MTALVALGLTLVWTLGTGQVLRLVRFDFPGIADGLWAQIAGNWLVGALEASPHRLWVDLAGHERSSRGRVATPTLLADDGHFTPLLAQGGMDWRVRHRARASYARSPTPVVTVVRVRLVEGLLVVGALHASQRYSCST